MNSARRQRITFSYAYEANCLTTDPPPPPPPPLPSLSSSSVMHFFLLLPSPDLNVWIELIQILRRANCTLFRGAFFSLPLLLLLLFIPSFIHSLIHSLFHLLIHQRPRRRWRRQQQYEHQQQKCSVIVCDYLLHPFWRWFYFFICFALFYYYCHSQLQFMEIMLLKR